MVEAWHRIEGQARTLPTEVASLDDARGRVLANDVISEIDLPPFDNSAMDGYALRAACTDAALDSTPVLLRLCGTIAAGSVPDEPVTPGTAQRIMTGAPVPSGADAVLQLEHARHRDDVIEVRDPVAVGRHIRRRGEDVGAGELIVRAGTTLTTNVIALMASAGISEATVFRRARISTIATGAELIAAVPGARLRQGQIFDSNGISMRALAADAGCIVIDRGIVHDSADAIKLRIAEAAAESDIVLISGGVSVGRFDHVKKVLAELGMERLFWRVRMKPGKPLLCGKLGDTWVFGLPGNPISCVAGIVAFVEPLIRVLHGHTAAGPAIQRARLTEPFSHDGGRLLLATAHIERASDGMLAVTPTRTQGSAMMHALAASNGFLVVPEDQLELAEGSIVDVLEIA